MYILKINHVAASRGFLIQIVVFNFWSHGAFLEIKELCEILL